MFVYESFIHFFIGRMFYLYRNAVTKALPLYQSPPVRTANQGNGADATFTETRSDGLLREQSGTALLGRLKLNTFGNQTMSARAEGAKT